MKLPFSLSVPETRAWLPAVALILCLSMIAIAAVALFTVGADPESGPASLPTSIAAQGYQGLKRMLVARGHETSTNRFEDGSEVSRADIEIITLNNDGGVYNAAGTSAHFRKKAQEASASASSASEASEQASQPASDAASSAQSAPVKVSSELYTADDGDFTGPDKRRSDHILYHPLGRVVIVVAPKWESGPAPGNPRWAGTPAMISAPQLRRMLAVLAPVSSQPLPDTDDDDDGASSSASAAALPPAPPGKGVYDDGDAIFTYDKVPYDVRQAHTEGPLTVHGVAGQSAFPLDMAVGAIGDLQTISGPNLAPVLVSPDGRPLISRVTVTDGRQQPKVPVYLVSDPDLLNNQVLSDPRRVVAALEILDRLSPAGAKKRPSVVFNLTFNNLSFDHDLLHALSRPPFIAVPLGVLIIGLALMWAAFARFGPPVAEEEGAALGRGVRVLADNAARLMAISLKEAKLGPAYAGMVRDEVLRARGHRLLGPNDSPDELADRIGTLYGASESYTALKSKASNLLTVHQLIDVVQKLHAWKTEIDRANI
ncbi:hypothetical protein [Asticcacaulis solisilvae]|uniref:hypothetical protein n=1 Tax=Asticcacaulis solisilvae TaxID=1217274 RepID=UPI003FD74C9C